MKPMRFMFAAVVAVGVIVAGLVATGTRAATTTYSVTDLGSLGGGDSTGLAINGNGQVTGYSYTGKQIQVSCPPKQYGGGTKCFESVYHAFLYSNGTMSDLGTLGGTFSKGYAINLSGEVVGTADTKTGTDGFLWNGKSMLDLGTWTPSGIDNVGQIAGTCGPNPGNHACLYSNGTLSQLPDPSTFAAVNCGGNAINANGQIVGTCDDTSSYEHAVLWQNGTATDLGTFGGPQATAAAINNLGQVVGWAQTSTDANHGFLWSNGTMTDLGLNFLPAAINDNGVIVGGEFIYSNGTLQNLNNLVPSGTPQITDATGINNNGQIIANGNGHALLLTPN